MLLDIGRFGIFRLLIIKCVYGLENKEEAIIKNSEDILVLVI